MRFAEGFQMRQAAKRDEAFDRERPVAFGALREIGDLFCPCARRNGGDFGAVECDGTFKRDETGDGADERCLADTVGTDEADEVCAVERERQVAQHARAAQRGMKM